MVAGPRGRSRRVALKSHGSGGKSAHLEPPAYILQYEGTQLFASISGAMVL